MNHIADRGILGEFDIKIVTPKIKQVKNPPMSIDAVRGLRPPKRKAWPTPTNVTKRPTVSAVVLTWLRSSTSHLSPLNKTAYPVMTTRIVVISKRRGAE